MRRWSLALTLTFGAVSSASCGGGGGGAPRLSASERALVGTYDLTGFDLFRSGLWTDESHYPTWGGTMTLHPDLTADLDEHVDAIGLVTVRDGSPWTATDTTFTSAGDVATYTFDGTVLVTDFLDEGTGDREIDRWERRP